MSRKIDVKHDPKMSGDVAAMLTETMRPMLNADPASTIAGVLAFLAATAHGMTRGDPAGTEDLLRSWLGSAVGMGRRLHMGESKPVAGECIKFGD